MIVDLLEIAAFDHQQTGVLQRPIQATGLRQENVMKPVMIQVCTASVQRDLARKKVEWRKPVMDAT